MAACGRITYARRLNGSSALVVGIIGNAIGRMDDRILSAVICRKSFRHSKCVSYLFS